MFTCARGNPRCLRRGKKGEISARGEPWPGSCQDLSPAASILSLLPGGNATCASHGSGKAGPPAREIERKLHYTIFLKPFPCGCRFVIFSSIHFFAWETRPGQMFRKPHVSNNLTRLFSRYTSIHLLTRIIFVVYLILAVHYYTSSLDHVPDILKVHKKRINTKRIKKRIQRGRRTYHFQRHPTEIIPWLLCGVVKMCRPRAGCPPAILYSAYSSLIKSEYPNGYLLIAFDTKTIADDYRRAG